MEKYSQNLDSENLLGSLLGNDKSEESEQPAQKYQAPLKSYTLIGGFSPNAPTPNHTHHDGIDLQAPKGTTIYAPASGKILETGINIKGGNYLKTSHENGKVIFYYAHCDQVMVTQGQNVNQSTALATVGNSGNAKFTSAHLHLSCKVNGGLVNPLSMFGKEVAVSNPIAKAAQDFLYLCQNLK